MTKPFYIDWSQQPEPSAVWCEGREGFMERFSGWYVKDDNDDYRPVGFTEQHRSVWQGENEGKLYTVHSKPVPKWHETGELPPIGERVLMVHEEASSYCADHPRWNAHSGKEVTIVAHRTIDGPGYSTPIAVYETDTRGAFEYHAMIADCFKPLPTEEEKAEAEKEAFIKEAHAVCLDGGSWGLENMLGRMYDAGYRRE